MPNNLEFITCGQWDKHNQEWVHRIQMNTIQQIVITSKGLKSFVLVRDRSRVKSVKAFLQTGKRYSTNSIVFWMFWFNDE